MHEPPSSAPQSVVPAGLPVPAAPAPKKRNTLLIVAVALGVPLVLCLGLAGATALVMGTAKKGPLQPGDEAALLTAADLLAASGSDAVVDTTKEVRGRERYFDGSVELNYEYESSEPTLYVTTMIQLEKSVSDAKAQFFTTSAGGGVGVALSGEKNVKLEDRPGLVTWGDDVTAKVMTSSGHPAGNFIVVRKGDRVFMAMIAGVYFEDAEALASVLEPKLEAMMKLER